MGRSTPKTDLAGDLNKLISQGVRKNKTSLQPRAPRAPIEAQKGSGREGVATGGGGSQAVDKQGVLASSDGAFIIYYDYHEHD